DRTLGHTLSEFLDGDRLGQNNLANDLFARFVVERTLEFFLAATHRRQGASTRFITRQGGGQGQLATPTVFLTLFHRLGRNDLGLDRAALDDRSTAARLLGLVIGDHRQCLANNLLFGRGTALGLFLGTTTCLRLGLQAGFFLGLTARGFFLLAPAALIFLGTTNRILGRALALLDLTDTG